MATDIQWTDETWNPVTGCSKVSPGCAHCYAEGVANRFWASQYPAVEFCAEQPPRPRQFTDVWTHEDRLDQPLRWKKPRKVFVNSMSDLFHEDVPDAFIDRVFAVMALAPKHTFQILTKRADRMRTYLTARADACLPECVRDAAYLLMPQKDIRSIAGWDWPAWPLPNVWLGVSVENQHFADERIPLLLNTPAAVRFLSCEPLLEGLDLAKHRPGANRLWVIVGGESGKGARPCNVGWVRSIVRQCQESDTPVFVKQLGAKPIEGPGCYCGYETAQRSISLRDSHGGDMNEWPEDLRVREFPLSDVATNDRRTRG